MKISTPPIFFTLNKPTKYLHSIVMKISPSVLDADFGKFQSEIDSIATADRIHLDVMDGQYVPNLSFGSPVLEGIDYPIETEAHLMVNNPENFIDMFAEVGCKTITFHIENTGRAKALEIMKSIKAKGIKPGICVDGYTDINFLDDEILNTAEQILLMSVKAGFGGQAFMPEVLEKAKALRARGYTKEIEVDGGVTLDNVEALKEAGVDIVVVGSFLMKKEEAERAEIIKAFQAV